MGGTAPRTIVIADDHPLMRESIAACIQDGHARQLKVVAQASDGVEAVEAVRKFAPDVLLVDLGMPRLDGIHAVQQIKKIKPDIRVFVFSMYEDQAHVVEAIRAGADDYLFKKDATASVVVTHILRALGDPNPTGVKLQSRLFQAIRGADADALDVGFTRLTGAELEVLKLIAFHGCSMKEVADQLGGPGGRLSAHTVRKHLEHIYEKLGARSQAHAVSIAIKLGLISSDETEPAS